MDQSSKQRREGRLRRKARVRRKVSGTPERPRLSVFRSHRSIYAQVVVDEIRGTKTLFSVGGLKLADEAPLPEGLAGKCAVAYRVGRQVAAVAKEKGIAQIVFDRGGYLYHGRIAALARGVRDGGIQF
jgi:large subunit ribosomal protein L18